MVDSDIPNDIMDRMRAELEDPTEIVKRVDVLLDDYFWLPTLDTHKRHAISHDDHDGNPASGVLTLTIGMDGDIWIKTTGTSLRYRMHDGGGKYPRVRNALFILAHAMAGYEEQDKRDNGGHAL